MITTAAKAFGFFFTDLSCLSALSLLFLLSLLCDEIT